MTGSRSRILCTFPGRAGDLLWALPTVRAISETVGEPVDLQIAGEFEGMLDLLRQQPYLGHVCAHPHWGLTPPNEWQAPAPIGTPEGTYEHVIHLGYRGWPTQPLPRETWELGATLFRNQTRTDLQLIELRRPWITVAGRGIPLDIAVGFTEAWFELKYGLLMAVERLLGLGGPTMIQLTPRGTRWTTEVGPAMALVESCGWLDAARAIRNSDLFLGDCSALHVLALALGKPVVILEPMEARWNPIFFPFGMDGPEITVVKGNDGRPTHDARHCADTLREVLHGR